MNNTQLKLALILLTVSQQYQKPDSDFWLPDGGTHLYELAKYAGIDPVSTESEFTDMEKKGYAEITTRKDGGKGARLTKLAIDEIKVIEDQQRVIDDAQAQAQAILDYEKDVEKIMQTAIKLGYQIIKQ